jgi:hypothetical protein
LGFQLDLGQELYDWAYKFSLYNHWFSREVTGNAIKDGRVESRFDWGAKAALQFDFDNEWAADFEVGLRLPGRKRDVDSAGYTHFDYEFTFAAGPSYQFHRDLSVAFKFYTKYEKGYEHNTKNTDFHTTTYGGSAGLSYVF